MDKEKFDILLNKLSKMDNTLESLRSKIEEIPEKKKSLSLVSKNKS